MPPEAAAELNACSLFANACRPAALAGGAVCSAVNVGAFGPPAAETRGAVKYVLKLIACRLVAICAAVAVLGVSGRPLPASSAFSIAKPCGWMVGPISGLFNAVIVADSSPGAAAASAAAAAADLQYAKII